MVTGWIDLARSMFGRKNREFVSVDARYDVKSDNSAYEMLSKDHSGMVTSLPPVRLSETPTSPLKSPDYYGKTARYQPPVRSFSSPRPPTSPTGWDPSESYAKPIHQQNYYMDEDEERGGYADPYRHGSGGYGYGSRSPPQGRREYEDMNPLGMNRI